MRFLSVCPALLEVPVFVPVADDLDAVLPVLVPFFTLETLPLSAEPDLLAVAVCVFLEPALAEPGFDAGFFLARVEPFDVFCDRSWEKTGVSSTNDTTNIAKYFIRTAAAKYRILLEFPRR